MTTPLIEEIAKALTQKILLEPNFVVEEMLTQALTEAHQAGIDEAVEETEKARREGYAVGYAQCCADNNLMTHEEMEDDIKALQDKE